MFIRTKLVYAATLLTLGTVIAGPLAASADGNPEVSAAPVMLTPTQYAAVETMGQIVSGITANVRVLALQRTNESALFGQMAGQLNGILIQLQQGNPTQDQIASMSATVSSMTAEVSAIVNRRSQENAVLAQLSSVLGLLANWLTSLQ